MHNQKIESKIDLTPKTAYLTGVIIGDGNLCGSTKSKTDLSPDYRISIDISDKEYLLNIEQIIKSLIQTKTIPKQSPQRGDRIPRWYLAIRNKGLFNFLCKDMEIPMGKKSNIVSIPPKILSSSDEIKKHFLAGYFDTDGGFRANALGFTMASKMLWMGVSKLLNEFNISHSKDRWINKKYNKEFFGIRIRKGEIDNFLNILPLQNKEKLGRINQRFKCGDAGVAKRDRDR